MKKLLCLVLGVLMLPGLAFAQDDAEIADQLRDIKKSRRKLTSEFNKLKSAAEDDSEKASIMADRLQAEIELTLKAISLCEQGDNEKLEIETLAWLSRYAKGKARSLAGDALAKDYLESENLDVWILALSKIKTPLPETEKWLRAIKENSSDKNIKGQAVYVLHNLMKQLADASESERAEFAESIGENGEEYLARRSKERCEKEVEWLGKLCIDEYGDVKFGRVRIGSIFEKLRIQRMLAIGKVAPDIVGEDLDGVEFKLSDYRGKIVVLDFWGDW